MPEFLTRKSEVSTRVTELALRKAALIIAKDQKSLGEGKAKEGALSHIALLTHGAEDVKKQLSGLGWQEGLVVAGISAIAFSVSATLEQLECLGHARLNFDKELKAGNATFLIPVDKEYRNLAKHQIGIDSFVELSENHRDIFPYLGLEIHHVKEGHGGKLISVLPFYRMSHKVPESLSSDSTIDKIKQSITLFFKTEINVPLKSIDEDFADDSTFVDFLKSSWQGDNFLNNYRGPRVIIMSLGVLLWHLQNPIDIATDTELTLDEKIELCSKAEAYINDLLNKDQKPNIDKLDPSGDLASFIQKIETYTISLKEAFEEEQNKTLTLNYVCTYAQRSSRILNENIFSIIYRKENQSATLASKISYLTLLLDRDPYLLWVLTEFKYTHPLSNTIATTIIDLLLVYVQLDTKKKTEFEAYLMKGNTSIRKSFALTLKEIDTAFIKPIYEREKKNESELTKVREEHKRKNKYSLLSSIGGSLTLAIKSHAMKQAFLQFMPLVGLAVNDYNILIDTRESKESSVRNQMINEVFYTARQQINSITKAAFENDQYQRGTFIWELSSYINVTPKVKDTLNQLCPNQYTIGRVTNLIKTIQKFINKYHSYLLKPEFKAFIIRCFDKVNSEFYQLKMLCFELQDHINSATTEDRNLIRLVHNMEEDLSSEISSFINEVKKNRTKLLSASFEANIKAEILFNLSKISNKYSEVFGSKDEDLALFIEEQKDEQSVFQNGENVEENDPPIIDEENAPQMPEGVAANYDANFYNQRSKLSKLIFECYHQMSYLSKQGTKGLKLLELHDRIMNKTAINEDNFKREGIELGQIVFAYRPSLFFQAPYAYTRSSEVLIESIISSANSHEDNFPLYDWLLEESNEFEKKSGLHTKDSIARKLFSRKEAESWPLSTEEFSPLTSAI